MPAEWKPHDGIWLQWPRNKVEPGHGMEQEHTWLKMVAAPYQHETVYIITSDEQQRDHVVCQLDYFGIGPDGRYLGKYRKMHIPEDPLYYEKFYFAPGDLGYKTFRTRFADIGVLICWDQWFPEAARLTTMKGGEIIFIPTAIGFTPAEISISGAEYANSWQIVQRGHAVVNACFLAAANRVGFEDNPEGKEGIDFWGQSFVSDPNGKVLARAADDQEEVLDCPVDLAFIDQVRDGYCFPFRDRRVESYGELTKLYVDN
jgi:N-carbamoylputrescine amidase